MDSGKISCCFTLGLYIRILAKLAAAEELAAYSLTLGLYLRILAKLEAALP
jgi:hypothetical protein